MVTAELSEKVIEGFFFAFEIFHSEIYLVGKFGGYFFGYCASMPAALLCVIKYNQTCFADD